MFGIGMPELIIILVILLVVFGAKRLPEMGAGLGKGIKNFKKSLGDSDKEIASADENPEDSSKDS